MSNYLGVALIIFVAKFGFVDGKIVIPPMEGKSVVELMKSVSRLLGSLSKG